MIFENEGWVIRDYYLWLLDIVHGYEVKYSFHGVLLSTLFEMEFVDVNGLDSDRVKDGLDLRNQYFQATGNDISVAMNGRLCSVLELLIGVSLRCNSVVGMPEYPVTHIYFWEMVQNLGLFDCIDGSDEGFPREKVVIIVGNWMNRRYDSSGYGSIFPLRRAASDQRTTPIWNQMCAYLNENAGF